MRPNPNVLVFVFYTASCYCGVIDDTLFGQYQDRGRRAAAGWPQVAGNYDDRSEVDRGGITVGPSVHSPYAATVESFELRSGKQKRCPSLQQTLRASPNFNGDEMVSAMTPSGIQRREVQVKLMRKLCTNCKASLQCKMHNKCNQCSKWCVNEDLSPNDITDILPSSTTENNEVPVVSSSNGINEFQNETGSDDPKISFPNRFSDVREETGDTGMYVSGPTDRTVSLSAPNDDSKISLPAPDNRFFTIASYSAGPIKEVILMLLGVQNTSDVDNMVVWVTTFSNRPPKMAPENMRTATSRLQNASLLNHELKKAKDQGKQYLTNEDLEEVAQTFLGTKTNDGSTVGKPSGARSSSYEELLPSYPIDQDRTDLARTRKINPDLIEDTFDPRLLDDSRDMTEFPTAPRLGIKNKHESQENSVSEEDRSEIMEPSAVEETGDMPNQEPIEKTTETEAEAEDAVNSSPNLPNPEDNGNEAPSVSKSETAQPKTDTVGMIKQSQEIKKEKTSPSNGGNLSPGKYTASTPEKSKEDKEDALNYPEVDKSDPITGSQPSSKPEDESEIQPKSDKKESSMLVTKKLIQKLKDRMEQRVKGNEDILRKVLPLDQRLGLKKFRDGIKERQDKLLKGTQMSPQHITGSDEESVKEASDNLQKQAKSTSLRTEDVDPSLKSVQTPEEEPQSVNMESITKTRPMSHDQLKLQNLEGTARTVNGIEQEDQSVGMKNQDMQFERDDTKPDNVMVTSPNKDIGLNSESGTSKPMESVASTNNLEDDVSGLLQNLKKNSQITPRIVNDFDTAKGVLKDVENIVDEITKDINIKPNVEQKEASTLGAVHEHENSTPLSEVTEKTATVQDLNPTDPPESDQPEVKGKEVLGMATEEISSTSTTSQKTANTPDFQPPELGDTANVTPESSPTVGSQPIEPVIWDKHMDPRMFHDVNQRINKDRIKLSSPLTNESESNPDEGKILTDVEEGQMNDVPRKFPTQKVTVRGKEVPVKQKTTLETSPHTGTDVTIPVETDLGEQIVGANIMDNKHENDSNIPRGIGSRFREDTEALGSSKTIVESPHPGADEIIPANTDIGEQIIGSNNPMENNNESDGNAAKRIGNKLQEGNRALGSTKTTAAASPRPEDFESIPAGTILREQLVDTNPKVSRAESSGKKSGGIGSRFRDDELLSSKIPSLDNRGDEGFSTLGNKLGDSTWSNSLGALVPGKQVQSLSPLQPNNDIYFVGNGIKLPLQMVRSNDGAVHLSVDLDRLCACKNNTICPKNHTAIEQTVGTILEQASVKNELAGPTGQQNSVEDAQNTESSDQDFSDVPVGMAAPIFKDELKEMSSVTPNHNENGNENNWLNLKNNARYFDPNEELTQEEDINVFKRSIGTASVKENLPEKFTIPLGKVTDFEKESEGISEMKDPQLKATNMVGGDNQHAQESFQQFLNKKLMELESKMLNIEKKNELESQQLELSQENLINTLNSINKNSRTATADQEEDTNRYVVKHRPMSNVNTPDNYISKPLISPKTLEFKSRFKDVLGKMERGNELLNIVTNPISYKFKKPDDLQNSVDKLNQYVGQYAKENENLLKKEADTLLKTEKNSFIKKEVEIMNNILNFFKTLADKKE